MADNSVFGDYLKTVNSSTQNTDQQQYTQQPVEYPSFNEEEFSRAIEEGYKLRRTTQEDSRTEDSLGDTEWTLDNAIALVRSAGEGFTYNLSTHVGLAGAAAWAKVFNPEITEDYSTIYKKMREDYDRSQDKAEEQIGGLMNTVELAGGLVSPMPFAKANLVKRGATATGLGAVSGAASLEGTDVTAGDLTQAGLIGAGLSAAGMGVVGGAGKILDFLTSRKIKTDLLSQDGTFTPIFLKPQEKGFGGFMQKTYRNVLGNAPISGSVLREQQQKVLTPFQEAVEKAKTDVELATDAQKVVIAENQAATSSVGNTAISALKEEIKGITEIGKRKAGLLEEDIKKLSGTGSNSPAVIEALKQVKVATDSLNHNFRRLAFFDAFPTFGSKGSMRKIEELLVNDPRNAMRLLDNEWRMKGFTPFFNSIPSTAKITPSSILDNFSSRIEADDSLKAAMRTPSVNSQINTIFEDVFSGSAKRSIPLRGAALGQRRLGTFGKENITNADISSAYAKLGTLANKSSDPVMRRAYYEAQNTLVDLLEDNLPKAMLRGFKKEKRKWKTLLAIRDAAESTGLNPSVRGNWTVDDWFSSVDKLSKTNSRYGTGPLIREAEGVSDTIKATERPVTRYVRSSFLAKTQVMKKKVEEIKSETSRRIAQKEKELEEATSRMSRDPAYAEKAAAAQQAIKESKEKLKIANEALNQFNKLKVADIPTWAQENAAFNILKNSLLPLFGSVVGASAGGVVPALASTAATAAGLRAMASPNAQRIIAGQTAPQKAIQGAMQSPGGAMVKDILTRRLPVVASGMLLGEL